MLLHSSNRPAMPGEFLPPNYFRRLDLNELNPTDLPMEIDLGCGDGSFLVAMAAQFPNRQFLGVERLLGRARKVARKLSQRSLTNARVLRLESRYFIQWLLPNASISRIHLLFPDPWPKVRHHRRRLIQQDFLTEIERTLLPHGEFLFMTDHEDYFRWAESEIAAFPGLTRIDWPNNAFFYPQTDFQSLWESQGKSIWRIRCRKPMNPPLLRSAADQKSEIKNRKS